MQNYCQGEILSLIPWCHTKTVNYTYDTAGKLIRVNDGLSNRVTVYCYDSQNRLISAEIKENGTLLRSVRYDYNEYDQVIQKTETKGTEAPVVTTYEYNSLHLISGLTKDNVYQHTSYNELGLPEQTVMGYTSTDKVDHTVRQDTYVYGMSQSEYAEKELYRHQIAYGSKNETYTYASMSMVTLRRLPAMMVQHKQ